MKKVYLLLIAILIVGGLLRFTGLDKSPPSLNWDEAAIGYNGYSLSRTLRDEYGKFLPIFSRSFDDYKPALPMYLTIPSIYIFGLNEVGVRMPSALAGFLQIIIIFIISRKIFSSNKVALYSALVLATAPFSVFFSRSMFESNVATLFFLLGVAFFLYREKSWTIYLSILFLILSTYTYHSYKVLVPVVFITAFVGFKVYKYPYSFFKKYFKYIFLGLVLFVPQIYLLFVGTGAARFKNTNILLHWPFSTIGGIYETGIRGILPELTTYLGGYFLMWEIVGRYLGHFSPVNLFVRLSIENPLLIPANSNFFAFQMVFWLIGLVVLFLNINKYRVFVVLLLLSPIPSIINWNWFYSVRVIQLLILHCIVIGLGLAQVDDYFRSKILHIRPIKYVKFAMMRMFTFGIVVIMLVSSLYLFDSLMVLIPKFYSGNWQPGFRESMPVITEMASDYNQIIIESPHGQPYIFTLFYSKYPPEKYLAEVDMERLSKEPRDFYEFGKYRFRKIYWPEDRWLNKTLFMGTTMSLPESDIKEIKNARIIKDIKDLDGNTLVRIVALD